MQATLYDTAPPAAVLGAAVDVYRAAFGQAPYFETTDDAAAFGAKLERYPHERTGFRFVAVHDGDTLSAFALAVLAYPGQHWREKVANALTAEDAERWLGPECLEVIEVAVAPAAHGGGLGKLVHDILISGSPARTGALICHPDARPAQRLYTGRGWTLVGKNEEGRLLMARDL